MSTETTDTGHSSKTAVKTTGEHKVSTNEHIEPERSKAEGTRTSIGASTSNVLEGTVICNPDCIQAEEKDTRQLQEEDEEARPLEGNLTYKRGGWPET
jgi:hypothetical protein